MCKTGFFCQGIRYDVVFMVYNFIYLSSYVLEIMYCKYFFDTCKTSLSSSRSTSGNSGAAEASCESARDRAAARHAVDAWAARLVPRLLAPQPGESVQAAAVSAHQRPAQQPGAHPSHESAGRTDSDRTSHTP